MSKIETKISISNFIVIMVATVSLIVFPIQQDYFSLPKLIVLVLFLSFLLAKTYHKIFLVFDTPSKFLLFYLILVIASTLSSVSVFHSVWGSYGREEGLIAMIVYILLYFISKKYFHLDYVVLKKLLLLTSIVSLIAILQFYNIDILKIVFPKIMINSKITSTIGNRNFLGSFFVLFLPLSIWLYIISNEIKFILISGITYLSLLMTLTRSAWLGALTSVSILVYFVIKNDKNKLYREKIFILSIFFLSITLVYEFNTNVIFGRFLTIGKDFAALISENKDFATESGFQRLFLWRKTIDLIMEKPSFGWGPDTLGLIFNKKYFSEIADLGINIIFDKAHNEYLQIAYASGIPALLTYIAFILMVLRTSCKNLKNNSIIIPIFCSVVGYLVQAFFNISVVSVAYIFWIFLGALMYMSNTITTEYLQ